MNRSPNQPSDVPQPLAADGLLNSTLGPTSVRSRQKKIWIVTILGDRLDSDNCQFCHWSQEAETTNLLWMRILSFCGAT
jgi:hypothetical protein